jgi:hypothetical protein
MYTSVAKKQLLALLKRAKTRAEKAAIATRLANLEDKESKTRARNERMKAKREAARAKTAPPTRRDDGDEPFHESTSQAPAAPPPEPSLEQRRANRQTMRELGMAIPFDPAIDVDPKPPRDYASELVAAHEARLKKLGSVNGWTRTMATLEPNVFHDEHGREFIFDGSLGTYRVNRGEQVFTAQVIPANDVLDSDTWTNERGWESEARTRAEEERDAILQEYLDRVWGK